MATSAVGLGISPPTSQSLRGSKRRHVASKRTRPTLLAIRDMMLIYISGLPTGTASRVHWKKRQKEIQRLLAKHGKDRSLARQFPELKVEQRTAPCSNGMRGSTARRAQPPGMKRFPVGHSHKQGLELITPGTDLQWMGGKKT
jgi:hypothetical protein